MPMKTVALVLIFLFGSPEAVLVARAHWGVEAMCRCLPNDDACPARHRLAAWTIGVVADADPDPDEAVVQLVGLGAHESGFVHVLQLDAKGRPAGPAVSFWQLEGTPAERAAWLADPVLAATRARWVARHGLVAYSGGSVQVAAELQRFVDKAREHTR